MCWILGKLPRIVTEKTFLSKKSSKEDSKYYWLLTEHITWNKYFLNEKTVNSWNLDGMHVLYINLNWPNSNQWVGRSSSTLWPIGLNLNNTKNMGRDGKLWELGYWQIKMTKFPLALMGVLTSMAAHVWHSAQPPINTSGNFLHTCLQKT